MTSDTIPTDHESHETRESHETPGIRPARTPLRRPFEGRMLTGVAAGLADYLGIDVTLARIAFAVLIFVGGMGIPLYLAGLLLIPDEGSDTSIASTILQSLQR